MGSRDMRAAAILCSTLLLSPDAWAQTPSHKLRRGLVNTFFGWTELLRVPQYLWRCVSEDYYRRDLNVMAGCPVRALMQPFGREALGLAETLTFSAASWPAPFYGSPYSRFLAGDSPWSKPPPTSLRP